MYTHFVCVWVVVVVVVVVIIAINVLRSLGATLQNSVSRDLYTAALTT